MSKETWVFIVLFLSIILLIGLIVGLTQWWIRHKKGLPEEDPVLVTEEAEECCGQHSTCEKDSLLSAISKEIEYFDDRELDRFRGREAEEYESDEIEEFREILYTLRDEEVAPWARSLQLRQIELPINMRDELLMIVQERRGF